MAIEKINVGLNPNDGTGDTLRDAFIKVNENYDQIYSKDETYSKDEVDQMIENVEVDLSNYDTKAEVNTKITNALVPYDTKTEVNTKITTALTPYETTANVNTKLSSKADKTQLVGLASETWVISQDYATKNYVIEAVDSVVSITFELVDVLPVTGQPNKIYLVPNGETGNNVKDEYIWIENKWELIGNTDIDLSGYYTKAEVDATFLDLQSWNQYVNVSEERYLEFTTFQNEVYTKTEVDGLLDTKVSQAYFDMFESETETDIIALENAVPLKADITYVDAAISSLPSQNLTVNSNEGYDIKTVSGALPPYSLTGRGSVNLQQKIQSGSSGYINAAFSLMYGYDNTHSNSGDGLLIGGQSNTIATGYNSFVFGRNNNVLYANSSIIGGRNNTAYLLYGGVLGEYNTQYSYCGLTIGRNSDPIISSWETSWVTGSPIFTVGNGVNGTSKRNAYVLFNNGRSTQLGIANYASDLSAQYTDRTLVDKAYVDSKSSPISKVGNGIRRNDTDQSLYYGIGDKAIDFSEPTFDGGGSFMLGATGYLTFATGENNSVSGYGSAAFGSLNKIFGRFSTAFGSDNIINTTFYGGANNIISGSYNSITSHNSLAFGQRNVHYHYNGLTFGRFNDPILASGQDTWVNGSPIMIVGNGSSNSAKSNAYVLYNDGKSTQNGIASYGADYSASYTDRSLVDKGYVLNPETFLLMLNMANETQLNEIKTLLGIA